MNEVSAEDRIQALPDSDFNDRLRNYSAKKVFGGFFSKNCFDRRWQIFEEKHFFSESGQSGFRESCLPLFPGQLKEANHHQLPSDKKRKQHCFGADSIEIRDDL